MIFHLSKPRTFLLTVLLFASQAQSKNHLYSVSDSYAWVGVWNVATGKMIHSNSIEASNSTQQLDLDRNESTGQIICRSSDAVLDLSNMNSIHVLSSTQPDESIFPNLTKFTPGIEAIVSIRFNDGSPIGYAHVVSLGPRSTSKRVPLGPVGYRLAVLRNGNIVRADGSRINILHRSDENIWQESYAFESTKGEISELQGLDTDSHIAVWSKGTFQIIDVKSKLVCFDLPLRANSRVIHPVMSPDRKSIAINEVASSGESRLSIYRIDSNTKEPSLQIALQHGWLSSLAYSPSGKFIAIGPGEWSELFIYSTSTGKLVKTLRIPSTIDCPNSQHPVVTFSADGKYLYAVFINPVC